MLSKGLASGELQSSSDAEVNALCTKECAESIVQSARNAAVKGVQTTFCSVGSSVHNTLSKAQTTSVHNMDT